MLVDSPRAMALLASSIVLATVVACGRLPESHAAAANPPDANANANANANVAARIGERVITLAEVDERAVQSNRSAYQALYRARRDALEEIVDEV